MSILVLSASLRPQSRSRVLARKVFECLQAEKATVETVDLRDFPLPFCDGDAAYEHENIARIQNTIHRASVILIGLPVYNFDINAALKNLVELTGDAWEDKAVGFLCAAGGRSSYMSVMSFANDLMLDFRCVIIPRFVYATDSDFTHSPELAIGNPDVAERVQRLALDAIQFERFQALRAE